MKTLSIKFGAAATLVGFATVMFIGVSTPQPAGACSCPNPYSELVLTEVRLMNPPDIDNEAIDDLIATEQADWPETAEIQHWGHFGGMVEGNYHSIEMEVY